MKKFFSASDEEILEGKTTDVYFTRTMEVLKAKGMLAQHALSEFTVGDLPNNWKWGVFCGLEEIVRLMEGKRIDLWGVPEGTVFRARTTRGVRVPILTINGPYSEYCVYETPMLGLMCHSSGIATMAARCKKAAGNRLVISFGIRRMHPAVCPAIDRAAYIGGCDAVSSLLGAEAIGEEPRGTMPHALIIMFGDQREAFKAFDEVVDVRIPRVALIDTYSDEKEEAIMACESVKKLWAVRLDTPGSRKGSFPELIREVRWEMDIRGYKHVKIIVSGGIDDKVIPSLVAAGADGFGVGTSISNARTIDFAMDIVEKDGRPVAKRGKFGGRKYLFRCDQCLEYEVTASKEEVPRCAKCQGEMRLAEIPILVGGKRVYEERSPKEIRSYVLKQLERVELE
ncbi:MAG: nicotinate phosphoribosyltransferase [Methanomassiliicoccales archaeon]|nr:nicotinate phosphoribosyltransferase [Methanomassiliicoccales archaeon]